MKRATIYQIAQVCGVSAATVSRAFSRPEFVTEPVRRRITAVAEQLQYRPNRAAKGLANGRMPTLGLLVPDITNPFVPLLVRSVQRAADGLGYSMLLTDAQSEAATEPPLSGSLNGQIDGLILASPRARSSVLRHKFQALLGAATTPRVVTCALSPSIQALNLMTNQRVRHLAGSGQLFGSS